MNKKNKPKESKAKPLSTEEFIRAWETSDTATEVSKKTGLSMSAVSGRGTMYRKAGIPLKKFIKGTKPLDVDKLKALVEQIRRERDGQ